jgi:glutamate---cysteine ligase / carboxylate-amine ligase
MGSGALDVHASPEWDATPALTAASLRAVFDAAAELTVGVEEEMMLVDPEGYELMPVVESVLLQIGRDDRYHRELRSSQLEIVTRVCSTAADACRELAGARRDLVSMLDGRVRLLCAGTHPSSRAWGDISDGSRYRAIADEYTWAANRSLVCGLHVHVAVGGADRSLAVYNALRSYLPELGALAANSPFFEGQDTGLSSIRPYLNKAFPRAGVPPAFASWEDFAAFASWGRRGGLFPDPTHFWWDLRLHPLHGTVELRVADAQTAVADATAITALVQCLVASLARRWDAGERLEIHDAYRINENAWRGLRYGVRGTLVGLETGEVEPTRDRLARLVEELQPIAIELGCRDELSGARTLIAGNGAERQRYVSARDGMDALTRWLVSETEAA